jgi:hypothetical protein
VAEKIKLQHLHIIDGLKFEPPGECPCCGADLQPEEIDKGDIGPYITINLPIDGMCFYQCTVCSGIVGNVHAIANLRKIVAEKKEESPLIIPEGRKIILQ